MLLGESTIRAAKGSFCVAQWVCPEGRVLSRMPAEMLVPSEGSGWKAGKTQPCLCNCFSGSPWECFSPRESQAAWTSACCLLQVVGIWLLVLSSLFIRRDQQGYWLLSGRLWKGQVLQDLYTACGQAHGRVSKGSCACPQGKRRAGALPGF